MIRKSWNRFSEKIMFKQKDHGPEKWQPVFPRDKREAFAQKSCSNKEMRS